MNDEFTERVNTRVSKKIMARIRRALKSAGQSLSISEFARISLNEKLSAVESGCAIIPGSKPARR